MDSSDESVSFAPKAKVWLLSTLLLLSGCAGVATPKKEVSQASQANESIAQAEAKKGFTISDRTTVDPAALADFSAAIEALNAGDTPKGIELLEKVTKRSPNATAPYINLAIAYGKLNKLDRAEENLKTATKLNPDHPVANNEYGILLRRTGKFAEARATYEKILSKYPDFQPARKNLGVLCDIYLRDMECALQNYEAYSAAVPTDKPVTLWIVDLQRRMGK